MKYNPETETYELESGNKFKGLKVFPDGGIVVELGDGDYYNVSWEKDRKEIAEYMIHLWKEWGR